ncbi:hypothetical protein [Halobacillus sp. BBL2006]|uniref:hypothetical protein n=1 Tax=Halobacillus sp. BBL2006 TaxID=1543706 RepID=UPI000542C0F8|nr:hypothetical protein [Halobacillus sp. BBL2006]KHE68692.1 hypothetical protein LD39_14060 [Halobacillus sp. BBL2006]
MKQLLRDCLSMNEYRISAIIVGYFITLITAMYKYIETGVVDGNVQTLLMTFISIVAGIQVTNHIKEYAITNSKNKAMMRSQNANLPEENEKEGH